MKLRSFLAVLPFLSFIKASPSVADSSRDPDSWAPVSTPPPSPTQTLLTLSQPPAITSLALRFQKKPVFYYGDSIDLGNGVICDCRHTLSSCRSPNAIRYPTVGGTSCGFASYGCCRTGQYSTSTGFSTCGCKTSCDWLYSGETISYGFASTRCLNFEYGCCRSLTYSSGTTTTYTYSVTGLISGLAVGFVILCVIITIIYKAYCVPSNTNVVYPDADQHNVVIHPGQVIPPEQMSLASQPPPPYAPYNDGQGVGGLYNHINIHK
jgi:hypothetical protein